VLNPLLALVDRCLPPDLARRGHWEQLLRGRALAGVLLLSLLHTGGMVPSMLTLAPEDRVFSLIIGAVGALSVVVIGACLWALRQGRPHVLIANLFVGFSGSI
jgi:hypothetical protein